MIQLQIFHEKTLYYCLDNDDIKKSNWMRHVTKSTNHEPANLVACQIKYDIYFYTTTCITPQSELIVDYSTEYQKRVQRLQQQSKEIVSGQQQTQHTADQRKMSKFFFCVTRFTDIEAVFFFVFLCKGLVNLLSVKSWKTHL